MDATELKPWIARLPPYAGGIVLGLRADVSVEVGSLPDAIWLRGSCGIEHLMSLPLEDLFQPGTGDQLLSWEQGIPVAKIPAMIWMPLEDWSSPQIPSACLPASPPERENISLVRAGTFQEPSILSVRLSDLTTWAERTSAARFEGLKFAVSEDQEALVVGEQLPALPGSRFTQESGIATPVGFRWDPPVPASVVAIACGLKSGDLALLQNDGWVLIPSENFVPLSRSALRQSSGRAEDTSF